MAQTKHEIQALLAQANTRPRHRLGQNFMIDSNLVRLVAAAGELSAEDLVLEVGPGTGTLTEELLASPAAQVVAVEMDRDLAELLRQRFGQNERFTLIEGDVLAGKHDLNPAVRQVIDRQIASGRPVKLVANLPYNVASPLVIDLLRAGVTLLAFTVQKEVADRLRAPAAAEAYGPLSIMAQMLAGVQVLRTLPPQAFWPAPKIDSALVCLRRQDRLGPHVQTFSQFVHQLFSFRRKTLRKALAQSGYDAQAALISLNIDPQLRPETLSPEAVWNLFQALS